MISTKAFAIQLKILNGVRRIRATTKPIKKPKIIEKKKMYNVTFSPWTKKGKAAIIVSIYSLPRECQISNQTPIKLLFRSLGALRRLPLRAPPLSNIKIIHFTRQATYSARYFERILSYSPLSRRSCRPSLIFCNTSLFFPLRTAIPY